MASPDSEEIPAAHRVLQTTELLEQILLHLDTKTLLLSARTNRHFKDVIDGSLHLQEALFFKQAPNGGQHYGKGGVNPLLVGSNNVTNLGIRIQIRLKNSDVSWTSCAPVRPRFKRGAYRRDYAKVAVPASVARTEASWRRMYVKHGPIIGGYYWPRIDMCLDACFDWRNYQGARVYLAKDPMTLGEYEELAWQRYKRLVKRERQAWATPKALEEEGMETLIERLQIIGVLDEEDVKAMAGSKRSRW